VPWTLRPSEGFRRRRPERANDDLGRRWMPVFLAGREAVFTLATIQPRPSSQEALFRRRKQSETVGSAPVKARAQAKRPADVDGPFRSSGERRALVCLVDYVRSACVRDSRSEIVNEGEAPFRCVAAVSIAYVLVQFIAKKHSNGISGAKG